MTKVCYHCGSACKDNIHFEAEFSGQMQNFCCSGCLFACRLIHDAGQASYYTKRSAFPEAEILRNTMLTEKETIRAESFDIPSISEKYIKLLPANLHSINFSLEGIHCTSCVFINEMILSRLEGIQSARVNYETGRASVVFHPDKIKISKIIKTIQSIGYNAIPLKPGQKSETLHRQGKELFKRLAVSAFFAGNTMLLAFATWIGFFDRSMTDEYFRIFHWMQFFLATPVFIYSADTFHRGWKAFFRSGLPGMDVLVSAGISIAYFYSVYRTVFSPGVVYFDSVATIVFFLLTGRYLEWKARYDQRLKMESLVHPLPDFCFPFEDGERGNPLPAENIKKGDLLSVKILETVPVDGVLLGDNCELDESVLTGENLPVLRKKGDRVLAGSVVVMGHLVYRADSLPGESSLSVIANLAERAGEKKSKIEEFTLRIIPWFSLLILFSAAASFLWNYFPGGNFTLAIASSISVLIISCPCALALSVPSVTGAAIYSGIKKGILIQDGSVIENLAGIHTFLFDKTGTLTEGMPEVQDVFWNGEKDFIFDIAEKLEQGSDHPFGRALLEFVRSSRQDISNAADHAFFDQKEILPGKGIRAVFDKKEYRIGTRAFAFTDTMKKSGFTEKTDQFIEKYKNSGQIFLTENGGLLAVFAVHDKIRNSAARTIKTLSAGRDSVYILTGDTKGAADSAADFLGIPADHTYSSLLPEEKEAIVTELVKKGPVMMTGDGYNDAIALSRATVSAVMAKGSPLSLENAGLILFNNDLGDIIKARILAVNAVKTIRINLVLSVLYNVIMIPVAAAGYLLPVWCALFMSLSSLSVVAAAILFRWRNA